MTYTKQQGVHVIQHNGELVKVWDFAKNNWMRVEDCRLVPKSETVYGYPDPNDTTDVYDRQRFLWFDDNVRKRVSETSNKILSNFIADENNYGLLPSYAEHWPKVSMLTKADYQLLKEVLKEVLNPIESRLLYKNAFSREEVRKMVAKRNKLAALQWKIKKSIT